MSRQLFKSRIGEIGASLGVALLLMGSSAGAAFSSPLDLQSIINQATSKQNGDREQTESKPSETGDSTDPETDTQTANDPRFTCEYAGNQYTVMYHPEGKGSDSFAWATPSALGGGWTPEARCNEISRRLESYRPDGMLELKTAVENNYNVICVTSEDNPACRIVLTVPPGQDPTEIRDRVFQNLTVADSGQQTDAVNTFMGGGADGKLLEQILGPGGVPLGGSGSGSGNGNARQRVSNGINLRPFLSPSDGGTGARLRNSGGMQNPTTPRLNPDRFR